MVCRLRVCFVGCWFLLNTMKILVLLFMSALLSNLACASEHATGNTLYQLCKKVGEDDFEAISYVQQLDTFRCYGYLSGVADTQDLYRKWASSLGVEVDQLGVEVEFLHRVCLPKGVTAEQTVKVWQMGR